MAFSPEVFGPRAAAALDALVARVEWRGEKAKSKDGNDLLFHTITEPSGTLLEADILLSCSDVKYSPVFRLLEHCMTDEELTRLFVQCDYDQHFLASKAAHFQKCNTKAETDSARNEIESILSRSVLEFRKSIREMIAATTQSTTAGPVFSDTLYGPHVAKVLNALLAFEAHLASTSVRPGSFPVYYRSIIDSADNHQSEQCRMFAVQPGKGTAFAGDALLLQYCLSWDTGSMISLFPEESSPLMDALFPEFQVSDKAWNKHGWDELLPELEKPPSAVSKHKFESLLHKTLEEVRVEMGFVVNIVHGQAVTTLMAGNRRLGENSLLGVLDIETLSMIARMLIWGC